jgi:hypothetical protein
MKNGLADRPLEIDLVDIDEDLLLRCKQTLQPLTNDYCKKREFKLNIRLWSGSITDENPNLTNADACVCLELIEHVYPDVLDEIPFKVLGLIQPKIAIFSTPNCEFNVLFNMENKYRHYDHKFEWNRQEFKDWCENISTRFPYQYQIEGIGTPPKNKSEGEIGCCSQLVIFIRNDYFEAIKNNTPSNSDDTKLVINQDVTNHKLIETIEYPVHVDNRSRLQKIKDEISYHIRRYQYMDDYYFNTESDQTEIPLKDIITCCWEVSTDDDEIKRAIATSFLIENEKIIIPNDDESENYSNQSDD